MRNTKRRRSREGTHVLLAALLGGLATTAAVHAGDPPDASAPAQAPPAATQTRLNITLDGVPLQDPEDQALYFSNFGDFAPSALLNVSVEWNPSRDLGLLASGRWVDAAPLDNTGNPDFRTPSFFNLDLQASVSLARWVRRGEPRVRVQATNLLDDDRIWPSGYSYLYFARDAAGRDVLEGTAYYYPLATRSVYVTLDVRF